jgi:hypothetical protein
MLSRVSPRLSPSSKLALALLMVAFSLVGRSAPVQAIPYCPFTGIQSIINWESSTTGDDGTCNTCNSSCPPAGSVVLSMHYQGCCPVH